MAEGRDGATRPAFVLRDGAVLAMAAGAAVGGRVGGGPGVIAGLGALAVAFALRRPALVCLSIAVLAAGLSDRALAGLVPVEAGPVSGWAVLVSDPEPLDSGGTRLIVALEGRRLEASAFGRAGGRLRDRLAGEWVEVRGALRPPPGDAPWLVARRVVGRLAIDEVGGWRVGSPASQAANGLRRTLERGAAHLPERTRSLLTGVVLGDDRHQPPEVGDDFRAAGLTHLLAVSGSNVAFVLAVAGPLLTRLRWSARVPATLVVLGFFSLVVRFEPSVLRAAAMATVAVIASALGRPAAGIRVLGLAITGLLLVDPLLVHSVGFGLSTAASAGILLLGPRLRTMLPGPRWLADPVAVTVAAQLGALPLLLATFGGIRVAALPANLLAVPAAGPLMVWGLTAGLVAGVLPAGWAVALHLPTSVLTWWLAAVARWSAALPLGTLEHGGALALAAAALLAAVLRRRGSGGARAAPALAVAGVLVAVALARPVPAAGPQDVGRTGTVWTGGGGSVLVVEGRLGAEAALGDLRAVGVRCVDVVAVAGGGRAAAALAAALARRCPGLVVVAAAGRAHPGWHPLRPGEAIRAGTIEVAATPSGDLAVGPSG